MALRLKSPSFPFGRLRKSLALWVAIGTCTTASLVSCSSPYEAGSTASGDAALESSVASAPQAATEESAVTEIAEREAEPVDRARVPERKPQLIKRAQMSIVVPSVRETLDRISNLVRVEGGDLLSLQENLPGDNRSRRVASLQVRVPQERLDATLKAFAAMGEVENQSIQAEDVSQQLVDFQARLRNLRKSETMVLQIMERSGSVGEVLEVSRELSNIRDSIERIDAQLKSLQVRVAYSTIDLNVSEPVAAISKPSPSFGIRVQEAWGGATQAFVSISLGLLGFCIWLMVLSPFFFLVAGGAYAVWRVKKRWTNRLAPGQEQ